MFYAENISSLVIKRKKRMYFRHILTRVRKSAARVVKSNPVSGHVFCLTPRQPNKL